MQDAEESDVSEVGYKDIIIKALCDKIVALESNLTIALSLDASAEYLRAEKSRLSLELSNARAALNEANRLLAQKDEQKAKA